MPSLAGHPGYVALIDRLLEMRRAGETPHLAGSTAYYERSRLYGLLAARGRRRDSHPGTP